MAAELQLRACNSNIYGADILVGPKTEREHYIITKPDTKDVDGDLNGGGGGKDVDMKFMKDTKVLTLSLS